MISDNERTNLQLRFEALVDRLRLKALSNYEEYLASALEKVVSKYVYSEDLTVLQRRRLIAKQITEEFDPTYHTLTIDLLADMDAMAKTAGLFMLNTYDENPTVKALKFNTRTLLQGYELGDMLKTNKQDHIKQFKRVIANGITEGLHSTTVLKDLRKINNKKLSHVTGTLVQSAMKEARKQAETQILDKLLKSGAIDKVEWVATLELNTCPICRELDGRQWDSIDKVPRYPAHFRCRCKLSSKSNDGANRAGRQYYDTEEGVKKTGTSFGDITYYEWLELQPEKVRRVIKGRGRISKEELHKLMSL